MRKFIPPHSNTLYAALARIFGIELATASENTRTTIRSGERASEELMSAFANEVVERLCALEIVELRCPMQDTRMIAHFLGEGAKFWNELMGDASFHLEGIAHLPFANRATARIVTIDAALRLAGIRLAAGLGALEPWFLADSPGEFLKAEIEKRGDSQKRAAELIGVHESVLKKWFLPRRIMEDENIKLVADYLAPPVDDHRIKDTPERRRWRMLLRRHYAAWRLTVLLEQDDVCGPVFAVEVQDALVRLTNAFMRILEREFEQLTEANGGVPLTTVERAYVGTNVAIEGRLFSMLDASGERNPHIAEDARRWRRLAAEDEPSGSAWRPALVAASDRLYLELHAGHLGGVVEMRKIWEADVRRLGLDPNRSPAKEELDNAFDFSRTEMWDPPIDNIVPLSNGPGGFPLNRQGSEATAKASAAEFRGDKRSALGARLEAVRAEPQNAMAHMQLAAAIGDSGNRALAIEIARRAVTLDPRCIPARLELAVRLREAGRAWEARELLEATLPLTERPGEDLWFQLGLAYRDSGRPADAYWSLAFARSIDPRDAAVLAALVGVAELVGEHSTAQAIAREARHRGKPVDFPLRTEE